MSLKDISSSPNQKNKRVTFRPKTEKKISYFLGPDQFNSAKQNQGFFNEETYELIRKKGFVKTARNYLVRNNPTLLKAIIILGFPFFMIGMVVMFIVAIIAVFFAGIFIAVKELFTDFGRVSAVLLFPAAVVVGGFGATFLPHIFSEKIMQIHYQIWLDFTKMYFKQLCSVCKETKN